MSLPSIKDIVKDNIVGFVKYRQGFFYYAVRLMVADGAVRSMQTYTFPVPLADIGDATLLDCDKAIIFMRYIRKALEEGTFIKA